MKKIMFILTVIALFAITENLPAQGTAFTYQGQLQNNGSPANGGFDFSFALFNTNNTSGGQIGDTLTNLDVGVTNGLFTVTLDFGSVFTGNATWLAIGVRTNAGSSFTALSPLQDLTPAPYALYAPNAGSASSYNGSILLAQLPASVVTNGDSSVNLTGAFSGNGSQLTDIPISSITPATNQILTTTFSTNGIYTNTVPAGVNQMTVKLWGAGGAASGDTDGGAGAFSEVTLNVNPGQTYIIVVGQNGGVGGGNSSGDAGGGLPGAYGGNGGQASSLFLYNGAGYIMQAVAGGGGGGGLNYGALPGQAGGSGAGYAANALTTGVSALNLIGGTGQNGGNYEGGSGGGYGGGVLQPDGQASGGGSYGAIMMAGNYPYNIPPNTSDSNYVAGAAYGGNWPGGSGADGLAVVAFSRVVNGFNFPVVTPSLQSSNVTSTLVQASSIESLDAVLGDTNAAAIASLTVEPVLPSSSVGSLTVYGLSSIALAGSYLYGVNSSSLVVVDVSSPASPGIVGSAALTTPGVSLAIADRHAYVLTPGSSLAFQIFDISDPANPSSAGSISVPGNPQSVAVSGRYACVAAENGSSGLFLVYDVSKPGSPALVSSSTTTSSPIGVAVSGRYAFVAEGNVETGATQIFDISSPATPTAVGSVFTYDPASIAVSGSYGYVGAGNTFEVIAATNPASPTVVGQLSSLGYFQDCVAVAGRYVVLAGQQNNILAVVDVSTPSSPALLGTIPMPGPGAVALSGRYLYAANSTNLQIFDLGGAYVQSLEAGVVETGTLQTRDSATIGNRLSVAGGLNTGGSALVSGGLSVSGVGVASTNYTIFANGVVAGVGAYVNASDARYKTNITGLTHALEKVMAMRGVQYDWRRSAFPQVNFDDGKQVGFIAQELKSVLPEAVTRDPQGYYGIAYSKVIPVLVEAIKDQQKEMENETKEKNAEIEALKEKSAMVDSLDKQVNELKQIVQSLAEKK